MVGEKKSKAATFIIASRLECQRPSTDSNFAENSDWDVAEKYLFETRLGICQKIYTTQFSGEKILHTENA